MAALLVGISIMSVMMAVAMPVWNQAGRREKEAELVFRGEQYARAIGLFQRKAGPGALPPSIDLLVDQRFIRKKYKDPITNDDFAPVLLSAAPQTAPGQPQGPGAPSRGGTRGAGATPSAFGSAQAPTTPGAAVGGIMGVTSKSKEQSIRLYKGRNHYNEWQFTFTPPPQAPAAAGGAPGTGAPRAGGRGQREGNGPEPSLPPGPPFGGGRRLGPPGGQPPQAPPQRGPGSIFSPGPPPPPGR